MTGLRVTRDRQIANGEAEPPDEDNVSDPADRPWSSEEMLLALIAEEIRNMQYMYVRTHAPKGTRIAPPTRIDRPGIRQAPAKSRLSLPQRMLLDPRLRQRVAETGMEGRKLAQEISDRQQRRAKVEDG